VNARRPELGSVTPLMAGFAAIVACLIAVVVDGSSAYLQRERLVAVAEAAALSAADGLADEAVYAGHLGDRAPLDADAARRLVAATLVRAGAARRFPDLSWTVTVADRHVVVVLRATVRLPFRPGGLGGRPPVEARAAALVVVGDG
jgi:hypothetical protein